MYEQYWNLTRAAFAETHEEIDFVETSGMGLAMTKLVHIGARGGASAVVTGPAGVGKSALAFAYLRRLAGMGYATSYIANPLAGVRQVTSRIARDLAGSKEAGSDDMSDILYGLARQGRSAAICIDEAHTINTVELLENLRVLLNIEYAGKKPLSILFVGQQGVKAALSLASSFDTRLALSVHMKPFKEDEAKHYILMRLKSAGCTRGVFTRSAAELVCKFSGGIPRTINRICELCLLVGFGFGLKKIRQDVVAMVAAELELLDESYLDDKRASAEKEEQEKGVPSAADVFPMPELSKVYIPQAFRPIEEEEAPPFNTGEPGNTDILRATVSESESDSGQEYDVFPVPEESDSETESEPESQPEQQPARPKVTDILASTFQDETPEQEIPEGEDILSALSTPKGNGGSKSNLSSEEGSVGNTDILSNL